MEMVHFEGKDKECESFTFSRDFHEKKVILRRSKGRIFSLSDIFFKDCRARTVVSKKLEVLQNPLSYFAQF